MILNVDERWLELATFLCRLDSSDRDRVLALARRERVPAGQDIVDGESVVLVLRGEVTTDQQSDRAARAGGPGRLYGAGVVFGERSRPVISSTPMELARIPIQEVWKLDDHIRIRQVLAELAELDHNMEVLDEVLQHQPTLRLLPSEQREQLLQCSVERELPSGATLLEEGEPPHSLVLLLRGNARLMPPGLEDNEARRMGQLLPAGSLLGVQDFQSDTPPPQPYRISSASVVRVLEVPWAALRYLASHNRALCLRTSQGAGGRRGTAHLISGSSPGMGATALSIGVAIALAGYERDVALLDLDAARTCSRLKLRPERGWLEGVEVNRASLGASLPDLVWPVNPSRSEALLEVLIRQHDLVLVNPRRGELPPPSLLDRLSTLVHLHTEQHERCLTPIAPQQRLIQALRLPAGGLPGPSTGTFGRHEGPQAPAPRQILRVPFDPSVDEVFSGRRVLRQLGVGETPFGRASGRLARMLLGKAVGLALGGGGAWGFAHAGLIRAVHEAGLPIDYIAGSSFGAVMGAVWVAQGEDGLQRLEDVAGLMPLVAATCVIRSTLLGVLIDRICGPRHLLDTEVPVLAVSSDAATSAPFVLPSGTLADAVRSSSGFPGLFAHYTYGKRRLVDGGVAANVPAEVVHEAGADFILASNVVPRVIEDVPILNSTPGVGRAFDLVRSTLALMHRSSSRDASLADHIFQAQVSQYAPHQFHLGKEIAELGYRQALLETPAILAAYEADMTTHTEPV